MAGHTDPQTPRSLWQRLGLPLSLWEPASPTGSPLQTHTRPWLKGNVTPSPAGPALPLARPLALAPAAGSTDTGPPWPLVPLVLTSTPSLLACSCHHGHAGRPPTRADRAQGTARPTQGTASVPTGKWFRWHQPFLSHYPSVFPHWFLSKMTDITSISLPLVLPLVTP